MTAAPALGLIAGGGALPLAVARSARRGGRSVAAIGFHGSTDPRLAAEVAALTWLHPGEIAAATRALRAAGAREAVLAGKMSKLDLLRDSEALRPDAEARELLRGLADRRDDSLLSALADFLGANGIRLLPQTELLPDLVGGAGILGRVRPRPEQLADVAFGFALARAIAGLDVGQTAVVKSCAALALEAVEGTDAALRRGGALARGACAVKVAKPRQDPRFDVPVVGAETLRVAAEAGLAVLAFEAGRTLLLERDEAVALADAAGIALLGVVEGRLPQEAP
jgi:DUF1009 family protein